jgi:hypothetical protein
VVESYLIAGSTVVSPGRFRAVADADGKYRLLGLPKGAGSTVRIVPPDGEPYPMALARVPDGPGLEPVTVDVAIKRGVWITGRVTDQATGRPVPARISYAVDGDNPNLGDYPGLAFDVDRTNNFADGKFRFAGLPGRGVVAAQAVRPAGHRTRVGAEKVKDLDRFLTPVGGARGVFPRDYHTIAEVNPAKGAESVTCELVLVAGASRAGTVADPDGKPVSGFLACGLEQPDLWDNRPAREGGFTVHDLKPDEPRLVQFTHRERNLAGSVVVRGEEKGPLTVRLEPAGTLTGRFVTADGKPLADLEIIPVTREPVSDPSKPTKPDVTVGSFPYGLRTDKEGKFRITGLAPGLKYKLAVRRGMFLLTPNGDVAAWVTVKAGETKDLGAVTINTNDE